MIGSAFQYKGIDFTQCTQAQSYKDNGYSILLELENHPTDLRTNVSENANYHGGYTSETLANPRLFSFSGKINATSKALRHTAWNQLVGAIQPESNTGSLNRGFYQLDFKDDAGNDRFVMAKVFTAPQPALGTDLKFYNHEIGFTFELIAEIEKIYGDQKTETGGVGFQGGMTLSKPLSSPLSGYAGYITCTNDGNWASPVTISVVGNVVNPKLINITNGNKYRLTTTTNNLIFDNVNLENDPTKRLVVTDSGTDIRQYRSSGASIFLEPGDNQMVVLGDSYDEDTTVSITFYDSYLF